MSTAPASRVTASRVTEAFSAAAAESRAALIGYLPVGFPTVPDAIAAAKEMVQAGCDILEIGLPYSDPLIDGPVIQDAVHQALVNGTRVADVLHSVEALAAGGVPVLVMTYWNPIDHYGVDAFARDLASAGGSGLITPDLPPEEASEWIAAADNHDLDRVFLAAPSSPPDRLKLIAGASRGFIYAASVMGITGARATVGEAAEGLVSAVREHTKLPVAVGLGVSSGAQAKQVARFADGVIVGSAFVKRLLDAPDPAAGRASVSALATELAQAVRS